MSAELHFFPGTDQVNADTILEAAKQAGLIEVVVIGFDKDGNLYKSTSIDQPNSLLWLIEKFRFWFQKNYFESHE